MHRKCQVKYSQQRVRPLAQRLLNNLLAASYNASGFHVREDVAPLKSLHHRVGVLQRRRVSTFVMGALLAHVLSNSAILLIILMVWNVRYVFR